MSFCANTLPIPFHAIPFHFNHILLTSPHITFPFPSTSSIFPIAPSRNNNLSIHPPNTIHASATTSRSNPPLHPSHPRTINTTSWPHSHHHYSPGEAAPRNVGREHCMPKQWEKGRLGRDQRYIQLDEHGCNATECLGGVAAGSCGEWRGSAALACCAAASRHGMSCEPSVHKRRHQRLS
jgi:hypothetical protein